MTVSPEEGEAVMQLLGEFARTVCAQDRRGAQEKLVDSILALVHGEPYLACTCGRDDCDAPKGDALPGRRAPLTQITLDVATLLGLMSEPAYLHGHGLIDPELARQLAASGTWQAMLIELHELADELGLVDHADDPRHPEAGPGDEGSEHGEPLRYCVRSFLARGKRLARGAGSGAGRIATGFDGQRRRHGHCVVEPGPDGLYEQPGCITTTRP
ncbi:DUF222 domain-containing protein [Rhodococcus gannanensis]|uniref:DUF222 domain-containing protein n=1 Tax=Rhodococcus gannanensis TaxID=1960308 RepID=A0ABW4P4W9_9NOCA